MADLVHVDGAERITGGRGYDDVVVAIDAGVGRRGREHGFKQDKEAAAVVAADRHVQIDIRVQDHAGQRIVDQLGKVIIIGAMRYPDGVKIDVFAELPQQGKDVDDLRGVGGKLSLIDGGRKLRGRGEIERKRDVLREIERAVGEGVLADIGAESVAAVAGIGGGGEVGVDLVANGLAHGGRCGEIGIVAADVQRDCDIEESLAGLERDGGTTGLGLGDAGSNASAGLLRGMLGVTATAA